MGGAFCVRRGGPRRLDTMYPGRYGYAVSVSIRAGVIYGTSSDPRQNTLRGYAVPMARTARTEPRQEPGETEQMILEAAGQIIATEDFDALSMRRVAASAGVSLSTVVRHFGTKD